MRFGLFATNISHLTDGGHAAATARAAEEHGFSTLWAIEHVVVPAGYSSRYPYSADGRMPAAEVLPIGDPLVWLAHAAAATTSIRLATGILILPQRNPVLLAKQVATLDRLSGGRVLLGVGVGWLEEEFHALGVPFEDRGPRTDDHIATLRALWDDDPVTVDHRFSAFGPVHSQPKPVQQPVPILVGGHSDAACRRAGRLGDAFYPGCADVADVLSAVDRMRAAATDAGRDPAGIEVITGAPFNAVGWAPDEIRRLADAGIDEVTILPPAFDGAEIGDRLGEYADSVIAAVNR